MSSKYVRDLITAWVNDAAMTTKYYPTINMDNNPAEDMWFTVEFSSSYRESLTFCSGKTMESGEIEVVFFGLPGVGYSALITPLEADIKTLMAQRDPTQKLVLMEASAPIEYSGGSADESYELSTYIEYIYFE